MPILAKEPDIYPESLFQHIEVTSDDDCRWWALYCLSNKEKSLMRRLRTIGAPHYGPMIAKRYRSPSGRLRTSFVPLFAGYVFLFGTEDERYQARCTGYVSRCIEVVEGFQLTADLRQIYRFIDIGVPLTPESRLCSGRKVRIRSGAFAGFEGTIIERNKSTRLQVSIDFLQKGASVLLEDCQLECVE